MTTFAVALVAAGTTRSSSVSEMRPRPTSYGTTVNSGSLCANDGAARASAAADAASRPQNIRFKDHLPVERARSGAGAGARQGYLRFAEPLRLVYGQWGGGFDATVPV